MTYRVPQSLAHECANEINPGAAVIVPLSGYSRLGIIIGVESGELPADAGPVEEVRGLLPHLSLPTTTLELCRWVADSYSASLSAVLRAVLPPGLKEGSYRVQAPEPDWPWRAGTIVSRHTLRRTLGAEALQRAEAAGAVLYTPGAHRPPAVEWATTSPGTRPNLRRAPRQRQLLETLNQLGGESPVKNLLRRCSTTRQPLNQLAERGLVEVEPRPEKKYIHNTKGVSGRNGASARSVGSSTGSTADPGPEALCPELRAGAYLWRLPGGLVWRELTGLVGSALGSGRQALVLVPERRGVEEMVEHLVEELPAGYTVAPYHGELDAGRVEVYEAFRGGALSVLVGTRGAALLPGGGSSGGPLVCVVDEPNEAYRSSAAMEYESVTGHCREVVLERQRIEGSTAVLFSTAPSLEAYYRSIHGRGAQRLGELPAVASESRPRVSIVDLRGTGEPFSETLLDELSAAGESERVGVLVNRVGYATVVRCNRCGAVERCERCDLPLRYHRQRGALICPGCGAFRVARESCSECGSHRLSYTGLTVERARETLEREFGREVGVKTADLSEATGASIVVGTAHRILRERWDVIAIPEVDAMFSGSGFRAVERGFRNIFMALEAAERRVMVQTRHPEHYALGAAVRRDYPAFARAELQRRRALGYPPYAHLAALTLEGEESAVRSAIHRAVKSSSPGTASEVSVMGPIPLENGTRWRLLLQAPDRLPVAAAASRVGLDVSRDRSMKVRIDIDPEEI